MLIVAKRDFVATVFTKGFLIGVVIIPLVMFAVAPLAMLLINKAPPPVEGVVSVIDRTGAVAGRVEKLLSVEALVERAGRELKASTEKIGEQVDAYLPAPTATRTKSAMASAAEHASTQVPKLKVHVLDKDADVEQAKAKLLEQAASPTEKTLAVVVVAPDAVIRTEGNQSFGAYELFTRQRTDVRVQGLLERQVNDAIVDARVTASGLDPKEARALTRVTGARTRTVTASGDKKGGEVQQIFLPLAFMMLLWISVFTGGNFLLTSTIEEKGNRVMEVLLSAVSPMELMTGKIIGQLGASALILLMYSGVGIAALVLGARLDLIEWQNVFYLGVFFLIAYFLLGSFFAAIGSAVNDIHEAQTLMTPLMMVVMTPMLLMMPIIMNPDGMLARVMSFIPPISPFVMVLRISSSQPPPFWEVATSAAVGVAAVYIALRITAKIFRIGVLMYGKPPNLRTLIKWVRMA